MTLSVPPTQLELEVSATIQERSWQRSQTFISPQGRWNAYLNQLCLNTFFPWFRAEQAPDAEIWRSGTALRSIWEVVTGTAIVAGAKRFVLIPTKTIDTREMQVPQEWVDIPSWAGDYFLWMQVDPAGSWVRLLGYTTHEQLKTQGQYNSADRTYDLDAVEVIQDLQVLWVVQELNPEEPTQAAIAPLPAVTDPQSQALLQRLANPAINPRLALPFERWGALLEQEGWRQRLYQVRQDSQRRQNRQATPENRPLASSIVNLSQWFQNAFDETWQAVESVFGTNPDLAFSFRRSPELAESQVKRAKLVNIGQNQAVLLLMTLSTETDGRIGVRIQLYSSERTTALPVNLTLNLLSATGSVVQSVQTREQDDCIQLKRFKCLPGTPFGVKLEWGEFQTVENFVC